MKESIELDLSEFDRNVLIDIILRANAKSNTIKEVLEELVAETVHTKDFLSSKKILNTWNAE